MCYIAETERFFNCDVLIGTKNERSLFQVCKVLSDFMGFLINLNDK